MIASMSTERVYAVHATRPDDVGAIEVVFGDENSARRYARSRSNDFRVLSASVTSYVLGQLGSRHPVAWFKNGDEQHPRDARPGPFYPADGAVADVERSG
jgi:hypothetical protein